jgi:C-type mannose receptor
MCQNRGSDLASIPNGQAAATIASLLQQSNLATSVPAGRFWIGALDLATEGSFSWSDGSPWAYTNWAGDQPDNAGDVEDCVEIITPADSAVLAWRWNDANCNHGKAFVCGVPGEMTSIKCMMHVMNVLSF